MTQTEHTPGPWTIGPLGVIMGGPAGLTSICETYRQSWANSQAYAGLQGNQEAADWCGQRYRDMEANAHLIAAAPDLLAALQQVVSCAAVGEEENVGSALLANMEQVNAAIAKATGQPVTT